MWSSSLMLCPPTVTRHDGVHLLVSQKDRMMATNRHCPMCPPSQYPRRYSTVARGLTLPHIIQRSSSGGGAPATGLLGWACPPYLPSRDKICLVRNEPVVVIIPNAYLVSQRRSSLAVPWACNHPPGAGSCLLGSVYYLRRCSNHCLCHAR